jgi:diacylglycerol kinase family enzyme
MLDLCAFRKGTLIHGLRYLAHVIRGSHQKLSDCTTARVARLRIESDCEVPYQLDGDPGGFLPVDIEVLRGRVSLLVPGDNGRGAMAAQTGA